MENNRWPGQVLTGRGGIKQSMKKSSIKMLDTAACYFRYWGKAGKEKEEGALYYLLPYHCLRSLWSKIQQG
ncbi:MAG: hypothetical protein L3J98_06765 [Gammaproteobacteria bacterium]|nr:hypothetical protein [Gammaproteobacteria bacterium]MCF6259848.1 hypothetical protein [Gammaproteobacteria bacterium]